MAAVMAAQSESSTAAIASSKAKQGKQRANELGIPKTHESLDGLLADPDLDAVYISSTNEWHEPHSLASPRPENTSFAKSRLPYC
jgi:1,5-anhydro-D-fructose reductase (1,5-anhydro-D-mannitol-forming)